MREELTPLSNSVGEQSSEVNTLGLSFLQPIDVLTTDTVQSTPPPLSGRTRKQKVEMHIALPVMPPSFSSRMFQRSKAHRPQRHSSSSSYPPPPSLTTSSASPSFSPEPSPSQTRPKVRTRSSQNSPLAINSFFYNVPEAAPVPDRLKTSPLITSAQSPFHRRCLSPPLVPALIYVVLPNLFAGVGQSDVYTSVFVEDEI
ncbi:hypothetical protein [Phaffia rhodozyma]|uniref:Uncharacterized protein n=1 Tax=Phaffia rhodozyma TaxID=264483 RepID=A0A0F7SUA9_PHARH|nr:hypothetical protein [Phaffia rhodozyma]